MTLGGLALAVGVLVDEATVEVENIHSILDRASEGGMSRAKAVVEACRKTALPRLLAMLCVLSVFVPSFFMTGVGRQLFVPLSIAVGFAMVSSYVLSTTLVPVMSTWMMREKKNERKPRWREWYASFLQRSIAWRWEVVAGYGVVAAVLLIALVPRM
jgi:multidrug efflux pump subunit AcrB